MRKAAATKLYVMLWDMYVVSVDFFKKSTSHRSIYSIDIYIYIYIYIPSGFFDIAMENSLFIDVVCLLIYL